MAEGADGAEKVGAASDAKARFAALKAQLLAQAVFYDTSQEERLVECDGADGIAGAKEFVADHPQADILLEDIDKYVKWLANVEAEAVVAVTPFKRLLEKMPTPPASPAAERPKRGSGVAKQLLPELMVEPEAEPAPTHSQEVGHIVGQ